MSQFTDNNDEITSISAWLDSDSAEASYVLGEAVANAIKEALSYE